MLRTCGTRLGQGRALFLLLGLLCVLWTCAESLRGSSGPESQAPPSAAVPETKDGGPAKQAQQQSGEKPAEPVWWTGWTLRRPAKQADQRTPLERQLFAAVERSDVQAVTACLDKGANVDARDDVGFTPLHQAARRGTSAVAELLIARGANVNARSGAWGWTPLQWAIAEKKVEEERHTMAEALIAKGADVNAVGPLIDHSTPLHLAIERKDLELVRLLVSSGANLSLGGPSGKTPLRAAVDYSRVYRNAEMVNFLLEAGAPLDIYIAAALGRTDYLKEALTKDPSLVNRTDGTDDEETALHRAAYAGRKDAVELLLAHGGDVNAKDAQDETPLHKAVYGGHREVMRILLEHGADVNVAGRLGHQTPLHIAAEKGDVAVAKILLEHGADVKARNTEGGFWVIRSEPRSGLTPLSLAVRKGHEEVADLLRQHGARE